MSTLDGHSQQFFRKVRSYLLVLFGQAEMVPTSTYVVARIYFRPLILELETATFHDVRWANS